MRDRSAALAIQERPGRSGKTTEPGTPLADRLRQRGVPLLDTQDPLRLVLHCGSAGISGLEADAWLLRRGLAGELPEPATLTFCLGLGQRRGLERTFHRAWEGLLKAYPNRTPMTDFEAPPLPMVAMPHCSLSQAWRSASQERKLEDAEGGIAAELLCPYPPGIPLLVPGEVLDGTRLRWLIRQRDLWSGQIPETIKVMPNGAEQTITA